LNAKSDDEKVNKNTKRGDKRCLDRFLDPYMSWGPSPTRDCDGENGDSANGVYDLQGVWILVSTY